MQILRFYIVGQLYSSVFVIFFHLVSILLFKYFLLFPSFSSSNSIFQFSPPFHHHCRYIPQSYSSEPSKHCGKLSHTSTWDRQPKPLEHRNSSDEHGTSKSTTQYWDNAIYCKHSLVTQSGWPNVLSVYWGWLYMYDENIAYKPSWISVWQCKYLTCYGETRNKSEQLVSDFWINIPYLFNHATNPECKFWLTFSYLITIQVPLLNKTKIVEFLPTTGTLKCLVPTIMKLTSWCAIPTAQSPEVIVHGRIAIILGSGKGEHVLLFKMMCITNVPKVSFQVTCK